MNNNIYEYAFGFYRETLLKLVRMNSIFSRAFDYSETDKNNGLDIARYYDGPT